MALGILGRAQIFRGLGEADLGKIAGCAELRSFSKGVYLFREGDYTAGFFVIGEGTVNVHRIDPTGHEGVIRIFRDGESFGEALLADSQPSPVCARAEAETQTVLVRRKDLSHLIAINPAVAMRMFSSMSQHLRELVDRLGQLQRRSVAERLRDWLLSRCPSEDLNRPARVQIPTRKYLLAAELGTVPETLSRTLARFRKHGWIVESGKTVTIPNPARLAAADVGGH